MWTPRCGHCYSLLPLESSSGRRLCCVCADALATHALKPRSDAALTSLYQYRGLVRSFVLRAKVRSDHPTLDLLQALALRRPEAERAAQWADAIMACPSSLWGRARGRLDVAHHLAAGLACATGRPLVTAAPHLFWRLRKRARHKHGNEGRREPGPWPWSDRSNQRWDARWHARAFQRLLLVDDVVTTGHTLCTVIATIPQGCQVRALTFAAGAGAQEAYRSALSAFLRPEAFDKQGQAQSPRR